MCDCKYLAEKWDTQRQKQRDASTSAALPRQKGNSFLQAEDLDGCRHGPTRTLTHQGHLLPQFYQEPSDIWVVLSLETLAPAGQEPSESLPFPLGKKKQKAKA